MKVLTWNLNYKGMIADKSRPECKYTILVPDEETRKAKFTKNLEEIMNDPANKLITNYSKTVDKINREYKISRSVESICKDNILSEINKIHREHDLDFICLQEASNLFADENTPLFNYYNDLDDDPTLYFQIEDFHVIIHTIELNTIITLINCKKYELNRSNIIRGGFTASRPYIVAKVKNISTQNYVNIINVHLPHSDSSLGETKDLSMIEYLKSLFNTIGKSNKFYDEWKGSVTKDYSKEPIIIAGDFNTTITNKISLFQSSLSNESKSKFGDKIKINIENYKDVNRIDLVPTCCYNTDGTNNLEFDPKSYDHILINDKLDYELIRFPIKPEENIRLSDHLPILGIIKIKEDLVAPIASAAAASTASPATASIKDAPPAAPQPTAPPAAPPTALEAAPTAPPTVPPAAPPAVFKKETSFGGYNYKYLKYKKKYLELKKLLKN